MADHLDETQEAGSCDVGDIVFLSDYDQREHYELPARSEILEHSECAMMTPEGRVFGHWTRLKSMAGSVESWVPSAVPVTQVF